MITSAGDRLSINGGDRPPRNRLITRPRGVVATCATRRAVCAGTSEKAWTTASLGGAHDGGSSAATAGAWRSVHTSHMSGLLEIRIRGLVCVWARHGVIWRPHAAVRHHQLAVVHAAAICFYGILNTFLLWRELNVKRFQDFREKVEQKAVAAGSRLARAPFVLSCSLLYYCMCSPLLASNAATASAALAVQATLHESRCYCLGRPSTGRVGRLSRRGSRRGWAPTPWSCRGPTSGSVTRTIPVSRSYRKYAHRIRELCGHRLVEAFCGPVGGLCLWLARHHVRPGQGHRQSRGTASKALSRVRGLAEELLAGLLVEICMKSLTASTTGSGAPREGGRWQAYEKRMRGEMTVILP